MNGLDRFMKAMLQASLVHVDPSSKKDREALEEALQNHIFDLSAPKMVNRKLTGRDLFFVKLFHGSVEISKSFEMLDDILFYIRRFPFQKTRITPERYLRFHVEAWFTELYVLQQRLTSYPKIVERQYKSDSHFSTIQARCRTLCDSITEILKNFPDLRGQHVHTTRLNDDDINRLDTLTLFLTYHPDDDIKSFMHLYHRHEYLKVRRTWKDRVDANNKKFGNCSTFSLMLSFR